MSTNQHRRGPKALSTIFKQPLSHPRGPTRAWESFDARIRVVNGPGEGPERSLLDSQLVAAWTTPNDTVQVETIVQASGQ